MAETIAVLGVGPSRGLGAAIARRFAAGGFRVFIAGRNAERLKEVAAEVGASGATPIVTDVTEPDQVRAFFDQVEADAGVPDAVVYNAGNNKQVAFLDIEPDMFEEFWRGCCFGGFVGGQEAARRMLPRARGSILFTGASAGVKGFPQSAPFAMGKFGLRGLAQSMARELHPKNIHVVHVVVDGGIRSERRGRDGRDERGPDAWLDPDAIADTYYHLHGQHRSSWSWEIEVRPWVENF